MVKSLNLLGVIFSSSLIFGLLLSYSIVQCKSIKSKGILKFVHIIYRHGDRTPIMVFPNISTVDDWPEGLGQLTNKGICEHYQLGQWLYERYEKLLGNNQLNNNIYIRSTDTDRTIESALANIAGMLQSTDHQHICNHNLINNNYNQQNYVHTVNLASDYLMGEPLPSCPAYEQANQQLYSSLEYQKLSNNSKPLYQYLTNSLGYEIKHLKTIFGIHDTLFVMQTHNKKLPKWSKSIFPGGQLEKLIKFIYASFAKTKIMAKLRSGYLLKEILDRCKQKIDNTLVPDLAMYQYSAHDTTIANMLNALGLYNEQSLPPPYASAIMFELREFNNEPFIEIYYKNSTITPPSSIYIPNCGYLCSLKKMYQLYDFIIPKNDFQTECYIKT